MPIVTKHGRVVTDHEDILTIKSHNPLITYLEGLTKIITTPLS